MIHAGVVLEKVQNALVLIVDILKKNKMDFRNNNKITRDYLEFTKEDEPNKIFTCKNKINPSTCSLVMVFQGLDACLKCKNFVDIKTVQ